MCRETDNEKTQREMTLSKCKNEDGWISDLGSFGSAWELLGGSFGDSLGDSIGALSSFFNRCLIPTVIRTTKTSSGNNQPTALAVVLVAVDALFHYKSWSTHQLTGKVENE